MRDIWAFLLQTLTVSGAAVLLLAVKALFRDKLSPRWQFSAWSVLVLVLLIPAGIGGRYVLLNWPFAVEAAKTLLIGDYTTTQVIAPIPLPMHHSPENIADWLFLVYVLGVVVLLLFHLAAYIRLRLVLRKGIPASGDIQEQIQRVAEQYDLNICPTAVVVDNLPSAFICGIFHPVLVLPAGRVTDDKILLHELLHLNHHDTVWSVVICMFRCLHWCNPLLWICANQAGNDLEALCDQRVLETLEGEERRDYGRILLSMANEKYARATGTTSMANGGRNIRQRIEAIARFKRYPAGMGLVSVCVVLVLVVSLTMGSSAAGVSNHLSEASFLASSGQMRDKLLDLRLSEARALHCTTVAGALDTYGKALLTKNGFYRAMCLPEAEQAAFAEELKENHLPAWDIGLDVQPWDEAGYSVCNLEKTGKNAFEGLMVVRQWMEEMESDGPEQMKIGIQRVRVELEHGRWIVIPLEEIKSKIIEEQSLQWGTSDLPTYRYTATGADFLVEVFHQKMFVVDNDIQETTDMSWFTGPTVRFNLIPQPNAEFSMVYHSQWEQATYLGKDTDQITHFGLSVLPLAEGEERPDLRPANHTQSYASGSSSSGEDWCSQPLGSDWGPVIDLSGGGSGHGYDREESFLLPVSYAADVYINDELAAELTLTLEGGGAQ